MYHRWMKFLRRIIMHTMNGCTDVIMWKETININLSNKTCLHYVRIRLFNHKLLTFGNVDLKNEMTIFRISYNFIISTDEFDIFIPSEACKWVKMACTKSISI